MKVKKPIKSDNIPVTVHRGRARDPKYDDLARKVQELSAGQALPIECDTVSEVTSVKKCLSIRLPKVIVESRGLTVYASMESKK